MLFCKEIFIRLAVYVAFQSMRSCRELAVLSAKYEAKVYLFLGKKTYYTGCSCNAVYYHMNIQDYENISTKMLERKNRTKPNKKQILCTVTLTEA